MQEQLIGDDVSDAVLTVIFVEDQWAIRVLAEEQQPRAQVAARVPALRPEEAISGGSRVELIERERFSALRRSVRSVKLSAQTSRSRGLSCPTARRYPWVHDVDLRSPTGNLTPDTHPLSHSSHLGQGAGLGHPPHPWGVWNRLTFRHLADEIPGAFCRRNDALKRMT